MNLFDHLDAERRQRLLARGWTKAPEYGSVLAYWIPHVGGGLVTEQVAFAWLERVEEEEAKGGQS